MTDAFTDEYYVKSQNGDDIQVFPMKLKYKTKVTQLMNKMSIDDIYLNLPTNKVDEQGKPVLDKKGNFVLDTTSYDAMMELFSIALQKPKKDIEELVDLANGVVIIEHFLQISGLKKKMMAMGMTQAGQGFMQDLYKIQA